MSDAPTQRFDAPPPQQPGQPAPGAPAPQPKKGHGLLITLIIVAALLVIAIVVALVLFVFPHGAPVAATTSPSPTVSSAKPSASATQSAAPAPSASTPANNNNGGGNGGSNNNGGGNGGGGSSQPTGGVFTKVSPVSPVTCRKSEAPNFTPPPIPIKVSWATERTQSVWIVQGTSDAADARVQKLPPTGDQSDFQFEIDYACSQKSNVYTLTLVGDDGKHVSKQFTIANNGDTF
jgi:hypothetical protein